MYPPCRYSLQRIHSTTLTNVPTLQATSDKLGSPFQSKFSKKLSVLGMTNLLRLPLNALPPTVQSGMTQVRLIDCTLNRLCSH
jgi:hypothetical protein